MNPEYLKYINHMSKADGLYDPKDHCIPLKINRKIRNLAKKEHAALINEYTIYLKKTHHISISNERLRRKLEHMKQSESK